MAIPTLMAGRNTCSSWTHGALELVLQPDRHQHGVGRVGDALAERDELVAAEAGDRVLRPERRPQAVGHLHEQLVADLVAEAVVDVLEVVEVAEQHRDHARMPTQALEGAVHALVECAPVRQSRDGVAHGLVRQRLLGLAPCGEVLELGDDLRAQIIPAPDGRRAHQHPHHPAVLRAHAELPLPSGSHARAAGLPAGELEHLERRRNIGWDDVVHQVAVLDPSRLRRQQGAHRGVGGPHLDALPLLDAEADRRRGRHLEHGVQQLSLPDELLPRADQLGDVGGHPRNAPHVSVLVVEGERRAAVDVGGAVGPDQPLLREHGHARLDDLSVALLQPRSHLGGQHVRVRPADDVGAVEPGDPAGGLVGQDIATVDAATVVRLREDRGLRPVDDVPEEPVGRLELDGGPAARVAEHGQGEDHRRHGDAEQLHGEKPIERLGSRAGEGAAPRRCPQRGPELQGDHGGHRLQAEAHGDPDGAKDDEVRPAEQALLARHDDEEDVVRRDRV